MPVIDVKFLVQGDVIPVDHGYRLYSAISQILPQIHGSDEVGLHPISGVLNGNRSLRLTDRSFLSIRLSSERIPEILSLTGKKLTIAGAHIRVGVPYIHGLESTPRLYSRLVTINGFVEPETFLEAVYRQISALDIKGRPYLVEQPHIASANKGKKSGSHSPFLRRTLRICDKEIVGFALRIEGLTAEESLLLQEKGIGGRRRFGCGIFIPDRR